MYRSICTKTNTNSLHTNSIHSILHKNRTILHKTGHVIQIVVHQFVHKWVPKKILTSENNWSPLIPRYGQIRRISTKEKIMIPYKTYIHKRHVESILGTLKNISENRIQFEYYNPKQCTFCQPHQCCIWTGTHAFRVVPFSGFKLPSWP